VLRIRDVLSRIRDPDPTIAPSRIPDPGGKKAPDPGFDLFLHRLLTNFVYLSRIRIRPLLHTGSWIRIPDPGGKKAPDPGSGSATLIHEMLDPDNASQEKI
jgi:hypothetical protein